MTAQSLPWACIDGATGREMARKTTRLAACNYFDRDPSLKYPRNFPHPRVRHVKTGETWERKGVSWFRVEDRGAPAPAVAGPSGSAGGAGAAAPRRWWEDAK